MRFFFLALILGTALVVGAAGFRGHKFSKTPIEVFPDMDRQARVNAQAASVFFADGVGSRLPVDGTLPMGYSIPGKPVEDGQAILDGYSLPDSYFNSGRVGDFYGEGMPEEVTVDQALLARGEQRFGIYCAICHGASGDGEGVAANFGNMRPVTNLHQVQFVDPSNPLYRPDGEIFEVITKGRGRMGAYGSVIPAADRWAIISYVRALQAAQSPPAPAGDAPAEDEAAPADAEPAPAPAGDAPAN